MQPTLRFKYALIVLSVPMGAAVLPGPSFARITPDQKAQQTLEHALQALGGLDRLRKLDSLYFRGAGSEFRSADLQGPDPSTPTKTFHEETIATFPSQEKFSTNSALVVTTAAFVGGVGCMQVKSGLSSTCRTI